MTDSVPPRNPWVAVALTLVCAGLGHVYCGRIVRGLALFCSSLLFAPVAVVLALVPPATPALVALILAFLTVLCLDLFAIFDAWRVARASAASFAPRDYNRPVVYLLLALVGMIYPGAALLYLRAHVFEAFSVPSSSMSPTILDGDRVLANKVAVSSWSPRRGDLVIFRVPDEPGRNWIKRIIGLPGDRVAVVGGEVMVNGRKLERDRVPASHLTAFGRLRGEVYHETSDGNRYLVQLGGADARAADFAEQTVPGGSYFVLGDNRDDSRDSRRFGFVPRGEFVGEVTYVFWPAGSWARFGALRP